MRNSDALRSMNVTTSTSRMTGFAQNTIMKLLREGRIVTGVDDHPREHATGRAEDPNLAFHAPHLSLPEGLDLRRMLERTALRKARRGDGLGHQPLRVWEPVALVEDDGLRRHLGKA